MVRFLVVIVAFAVLCALGAGSAWAETRVALVIGNGKYAAVPQLPNPAGDAQAIADTLRTVGFDKVTVLTDASRDKLLDALRTFAAQAEQADWAMVYYAGHGIEVGGTNYIIPTDARLATDRDVQYEAIALPQVMTAVEGAHKLRLVILDACRDDPFLAQMRVSTASRSVSRGLARIEPTGGVLVAYAAKEGQVAMDGDNRHSPFVSSLMKNMQTPGLEINRLFRRVRTEVLDATENRQEPFVYGSLPDEDFFFRSPASDAALGGTPVVPTSASVLPAVTPAKPSATRIAVPVTPDSVAPVTPPPARPSRVATAPEPRRAPSQAIPAPATIRKQRPAVASIDPAPVRLTPQKRVTRPAAVQAPTPAAAKVASRSTTPRAPAAEAAPTTGSKCFAFNGQRMCE